MLQVGSPKAKLISERINNQTYEGINFEVISQTGLTIKIKHNADNDLIAKNVLKKMISNIPETKNTYTNIQYIDESGRIL